MFGGSDVLALRAGMVRFAVDAARIALTLEPSGGHPELVELSVPSCGFGGGELVASPDERLVCLFLYSGQGEQGYALATVEPLRLVAELPYVRAQGDAPRFSPDGRYLVMVTQVEARARDDGRWAEDALDGSEGPVVLDWIQVHVRDVVAADTWELVVGSTVPRTTPIDELAEWTVHDAWRFVDPERVRISLPWGGAVEGNVAERGPWTTSGPPS